MPVPKQVVRMVLAGLTCGALVTTGACGLANGDDGPTAAEAGTQLAKDARSLLDQDRSLTNVRVSDDAGRDVACDDGKAKRSFAADARLNNAADVDSFLDNETDVVVGRLSSMGYELKSDEGSDPPADRKVVSTKDSLPITMTVVLRGDGSTLRLTGETACL